MNEITCCRSCRMKRDFQESDDKLLFLEEYWPRFGEIENIVTLPKQELMCALCLMDVLLEAINKGKCTYPKDKLTELVRSRLYMLTVL